MSATDVDDLIGQTRRLLQGMTRGSLNKLATTMDASVTSVVTTFELGASLAAHAYLCIDDEIMYVYDADGPLQTLTVERAQLGTTAAAHTAGAQIECNPRFPRPVIRDALQEEIASWPRGLYATASVSLSVPTNNLSVDLGAIPSTFIDILEVLRRPSTTSSSLSLQPFSTSWPEIGYRYERGLPTADFPSGSALFLNEAMSGGYTIRVVYSLPFVTAVFTDATSLVSTMLLEASMVDIPPYGAAARLLAGREAQRSAMEAQGEARAPVEVRVGETLRSAAGLQAWRDKRIVEEAERLAGRFRWRRTA